MEETPFEQRYERHLTGSYQRGANEVYQFGLRNLTTVYVSRLSQRVINTASPPSSCCPGHRLLSEASRP